ncbi:MAG: quinone-dependent dihydroorotate dehydrogenase [Alphaproteobacteria bacterium]|nr:quinone-dependent dihydroorotate dehydrogenase [Alphaproteobacteria bacterium]
MIYSFLRPLLFALPPELSHTLTLRALQMAGVVLPPPRLDDSALRVKALGLDFPNPFGLAAGFDKDALAMAGALKLGFGFCEVGTLTPQPQAGNPRPRIFRLPKSQALINRMGFNNKGVAAAAQRLIYFRAEKNSAKRLIGVNIGANRQNASTIEASVSDYIKAAQIFKGLADYITINISSPNTPHLRDLQTAESARALMAAVRGVLPDTPILVKIAPDLSPAAAIAIAESAIAENIAGLIISNTTTSRADITSTESGGVSGAPLFTASTDLLRAVYRGIYKKGGTRLTLIGAGGISTPDQAYAKIRAGASLLQIYTSLVYHGPGLLNDLKKGLVARLHVDGFATIDEAIGADHK